MPRHFKPSVKSARQNSRGAEKTRLTPEGGRSIGQAELRRSVGRPDHDGAKKDATSWPRQSDLLVASVPFPDAGRIDVICENSLPSQPSFRLSRPPASPSTCGPVPESPSRLLIAKRFNGIEGGRFACRIIAKEYAHDSGEQKAAERRRPGKRCCPAGDGGDR